MVAKLSSSLGREILHVRLTGEQRAQALKSHGLPDPIVGLITRLEVLAAGGAEARANNAVEEVTGRPPKNFDIFVQENKAAWQ